MFYRPALKLQARTRMRGYMGNAILVSLICALLIGSPSAPSFNFDENESLWEGQLQSDWVEQQLHTWLPFIVVGVTVGLIIAIAVTVFFSNVLSVGKKGWYMRYCRGEYPAVGDLFSSFRIYKPAMTAMLLSDVYVWLWSLLFIIPGIVKRYAYRLVPYIIYENPNLSASEAITLSEEMMKGYKWELFIFDLSFFWWNLLSGITGGLVGILYVDPYFSTAEAYVYDYIRLHPAFSETVYSQSYDVPVE